MTIRCLTYHLEALPLPMVCAQGTCFDPMQSLEESLSLPRASTKGQVADCWSNVSHPNISPLEPNLTSIASESEVSRCCQALKPAGRFSDTAEEQCIPVPHSWRRNGTLKKLLRQRCSLKSVCWGCLPLTLERLETESISQLFRSQRQTWQNVGCSN